MHSQKCCFLLLVLSVFFVGKKTNADDPVQAISPFTPAPITVPDGYTVELVAGPGLVNHPTMACLDDQGRLYVCENAGVNLSAQDLEKELPNSIKMLVDTDGDGKYDRATVFADKMTFPMGAAWYQGSLFVASPPNIWKLTDHDGDGVAEDRQILVNKFGYTGNAASIHGCFLGPDGRIYWCDGYHGHEFKDEQGKVTSSRFGSYLFSCKPDGKDVRIHCGGGMDNPVEIDFTKTGDLLGTVNILHTRPRIDCMVHWQYGGTYPHREKVLEELKTTGNFLDSFHDFGHVAISGTMRYRSGALNEKWQDNFFATFFNSGKVVRLQIEPNGSTFKAVQREFLSSSSRDFHPTDVLEGVDGSLLVVDTGGWFYRGCPTSQLAKPDVRGAIYRITKKGMSLEKDPLGKEIEWDNMAEADIHDLLDDSRQFVRERALSECEIRRAKMISTLAKEFNPQPGAPRSTTRLKINSAWGLTRIIGKLISMEEAPAKQGEPKYTYVKQIEQAKAAIRRALIDNSPAVRQVACHCLMNYPDEAAQKHLLEIIKQDQSPAVRRIAASALGRLKNPETIPAILKALSKEIDREEEHALIYALIEISAPETLELGLEVDSANVQRASLIVIGQLDKDRLTAARVAALLDNRDDKLDEAVTRLFKTHRQENDWAIQAAKLIEGWSKKNQLFIRKKVVRSFIAAFSANKIVAAKIGQALQQSKEDEKTRNLLLDAISQSTNLPLHTSWVPVLEQELNSGDEKRINRVLLTIGSIKTEHFNKQLWVIGDNKKLPSLLRIRAYKSIGGKKYRLRDVTFALLMQVLENSHSASEINVAAQMMGASRLTKQQLLELAPLLSEANPTVLKELLAPFRGASQPEVANAFLDAAENSRFIVSLPEPDVSEIIKRYPAQFHARGNALLDKMKKNEALKLVKLDKMLPLLGKGNHKKGQELFFSEKSKCATCHQVNGKGKQVGPDLSNIGANRASRDLLESIIFPSATIVRDYESFNVVLVDGKVLTGLVVREDKETLELQLQSGKIERIARDDIEEVVPNTISIMPNGLEKILSEEELSDVIAYLITLRKSAAVAEK